MVNRLKKHISEYFVGNEELIENVMICLFAGGHILLEGVPGVGKTTLASTVAKSVDCDFGRIQFTPDTLPTDVMGSEIFNMKTGEFEYREGAIMHQIVLADEINRTSPKTQSSLLEAMAEGQATVCGVKHRLPEPFMVIATQNSGEYVGTFPLPEAQLDRFMMKISMGYPTVEQEVQILMDRQDENPVDNVRNVMTAEQLEECIEEAGSVMFAESLCKYVANLAAATRNPPAVALGVSPRASVAIMQASKAFAYLRGRDYVIPEDIVRLLIPVFEHRIVLKRETRLNKTTVRQVLENVVSTVTPPIKRN